MSLCISVVTPEGIVVAGESRQTQVVGGLNRIGSDNVIKVFDLTDTVLACTAGWAFFQPQGATMQRNVSSLIEDFKATIPNGSNVQAIANLLRTYFNNIYQQHIAQIPNSAVPVGHPAINFVIAGYDARSQVGTLYTVDVPSANAPAAAVRSTNNPGAWWIGQNDVVARIINGFDGRIMNIPFVQAANQNNAALTQLQQHLSYAVHYNTMTLQDAIDFAVGMIKITTTIQRFTAGIPAHPNAAGVGGPIDVAVVRPGRNIQWVARKELHV